MNTSIRNSLITFIVVVLIGILVALAGSQHGSMIGNIPVFALCVGIAFIIQWLAFIPAYIKQTEKFYDLTGGITNVLVMLLGTFLSGDMDARTALLTGVVIIWAIRLGYFLFTRIRNTGKDSRFDEIKPSFFRFLNAWTIQGLWITFTLAAALAAVTSIRRVEIGSFAVIGMILWILGFAFEIIADAQKTRFKANPQNKGKFIQTGLWSLSRHPNYFGEISLWFGVALMALPVLQGWQFATLISPLFVIFLLTKVSGIPLLEKKADTAWGGQEDYESYKKNTPLLIPKLR